VTTLVHAKQPGKYDLAVGLLVDLRDLAARRNEGVAFQSAVNKLRDCSRRKTKFPPAPRRGRSVARGLAWDECGNLPQGQLGGSGLKPAAYGNRL